MSKKNNLATRKRQHEFDLKITSWTPPFLRTCWNATLAEKVKILDHFRNHGGRQVETLKVFQHEMPRLSKSLLSRWVTNENEIRMQFEAASASDANSTVKRARRIAPLLLMDREELDDDEDSPTEVPAKRRLHSSVPTSTAKRARHQVTKPAVKSLRDLGTRESDSKALVVVNPSANGPPMEEDGEDHIVDIEGDDPEDESPAEALKKAAEQHTVENDNAGQAEPTWDEVHGALALLRRHFDAQGAKLPVQVNRNLENVQRYLEKVHREAYPDVGNDRAEDDEDEDDGNEATRGAGRRAPFFPGSLQMNGNGVDVLAMAGEAMAGHGVERDDDDEEESDEEPDEEPPRGRGRPRKNDLTNGQARKGKGKRSHAGRGGKKGGSKFGRVKDEEEDYVEGSEKSKPKGRRS